MYVCMYVDKRKWNRWRWKGRIIKKGKEKKWRDGKNQKGKKAKRQKKKIKSRRKPVVR